MLAISKSKNQCLKSLKTSIHVENLASLDSLLRENARVELIEIGLSALDHLIQAIRHPLGIVRWEAAKILVQMKNPASLPLLIETLADKKSSIRWLAAEEIIRLGEITIKPLLQELQKPPISQLQQTEIKQILIALSQGGLQKKIECFFQTIDNTRGIDNLLNFKKPQYFQGGIVDDSKKK